MFAVKIHNNKNDRDDIFNKTINNISSYIRESLMLREIKLLTDNHCVEIISGSEITATDEQIVTELVIRKTIVINKKDINNKDILDRYIVQVKNFCDQAKEIEKNEYKPIHMR